ncbi:SlyX family protein [Gammaproteobacteria bacterium AS21]|jgi:SlyX protein
MESRITELESRVAFQEEMIDKLDSVISNQDKQIMALCRAVEMLNQKIVASDSSTHTASQDETPPPHY